MLCALESWVTKLPFQLAWTTSMKELFPFVIPYSRYSRKYSSHHGLHLKKFCLDRFKARILNALINRFHLSWYQERMNERGLFAFRINGFYFQKKNIFFRNPVIFTQTNTTVSTSWFHSANPHSQFIAFLASGCLCLYLHTLIQVKLYFLDLQWSKEATNLSVSSLS